MSDKEIKVPNIGEFKDVEIIEVLVSSGQTVSKNDPIITIESDKSSVEIPSSFEGKVKSVNIKVGDKVSEGDTILIIESNEEVKVDIEEQPKTEKEEEKAQANKGTIVNDISKSTSSSISISKYLFKTKPKLPSSLCSQSKITVRPKSSLSTKGSVIKTRPFFGLNLLCTFKSIKLFRNYWLPFYKGA